MQCYNFWNNWCQPGYSTATYSVAPLWDLLSQGEWLPSSQHLYKALTDSLGNPELDESLRCCQTYITVLVRVVFTCPGNKYCNKTEAWGQHEQEFWLVLWTTCTNAYNLNGLSNNAHKQDVVMFVRQATSSCASFSHFFYLTNNYHWRALVCMYLFKHWVMKQKVNKHQTHFSRTWKNTL